MTYTVIVNGRSFDLPALNLSVKEKMEQVEKIDTQPNVSIRDKYKNVFAFVSGMIGKENLKEAFDSDDLDKVDLNDVSRAYLDIKRAYDKPLDEYKASSSLEQLDKLPIDKIAALMNMAAEAKKK